MLVDVPMLVPSETPKSRLAPCVVRFGAILGAMCSAQGCAAVVST